MTTLATFIGLLALNQAIYDTTRAAGKKLNEVLNKYYEEDNKRTEQTRRANAK